jgi:nicotinate-nucleotide--dimethylbenzimidazole phosphoribosyltransferase
MNDSLKLPGIPALDEASMAFSSERLDRLTKPRGSLGRLEELAIRLAGIRSEAFPRIDRKLAVVVAGDHGVVAQGVSAYPPAVTGQMVRNFLAGGAAVNVLAAWAGAEVLIIDAGILEPISDSRILDLRMGPGTADLSRQPAMPVETAIEALNEGIQLGVNGISADVVACGEMGIGNSTAASALTAALLKMPPREVTGQGTGVGLQALQYKIEVIEAALALHRPDPADPLDVLAKLGGFEIAVLAGLMIGCAAARRVVVMDGLISSAAALAASRLAPGVCDYLFASHLSTEPGHAWILQELALSPLLDLRLRLGEGTGALLATPLLEASCRLLREMATFDEAGVSGRQTDATRPA